LYAGVIIDTLGIGIPLFGKNMHAEQILLISSEPLHPEDTYSSCFELTQARALQEQGVHVVILSIQKYTIKELLKAFLRRLLGQSEHNSIATRFSAPVLANYLLKAVLNRRVVLSHTVDGVATLEVISLLRRTPMSLEQLAEHWSLSGTAGLVGYQKSYGLPALIHAHSRFLVAAHIAKTLSSSWNIPYIVTEHSSRLMRQEEPIAENLARLLEEAYRSASILIAVSQALAQRMQTYLSADRTIRVIPNPLDELYCQTLDCSSIQDVQVRLITVGRLDRNKGHHRLLEALSSLKGAEWILTIVGDGPERHHLERMTAELGMSHQVQFLGFRQPDAVCKLMLESHAIVISSSVETFGVVAIEAGACGRPVLSTRCGGPEDVVDESVGILVDCTVTGLAEGLLILLSDPGRFQASEIRSRTLEKYAPSVISEKTVSLYKSLLQDP
jgi:glycosyltransferase involved in cell wall biosynthesis